MLRLGILSAVITASCATANLTTRSFNKLFDDLSKSGCQSCVDAGYGWDAQKKRCGGFSQSTCGEDVESRTNSQQEGKEATSKKDVPWEDTSATTLLFHLISTGNINGLKNLLKREPELAMSRSSDGRGPVFWAVEHGNSEMLALLVKNGALIEQRDQDGMLPSEIKGAPVNVDDNAYNDDDDDDTDFDIFDDNDHDAELEGYASPGIEVTPDQTREEYVELLEKFTALGCEACVAANFGWSKGRLRCGGFANSEC